MPDDKSTPPPGSYGPGNPPAPSGGHGSEPMQPGAFASGEPRQIPLDVPAGRPARPAASPPAKSEPEVKDSFREVVETIVFVVVLVLMLKTFLAEAFVIPTGSMATTLFGYHRLVTCAQCSYPFAVNASTEGDPPDGIVQPVVSCRCPNCGFQNHLP